MSRSWLFNHGRWERMNDTQDPYEKALNHKQHNKLSESTSKLMESIDYVCFERLEGSKRIQIFEYCGMESGMPSFAIHYGIGVAWRWIYIEDFPSLIQLLSIIAPISSTWPGDNSSDALFSDSPNQS